jgi:hypothetical protein
MKKLLVAVAASAILLGNLAVPPLAYAQEKGKRDESKGKVEEKGKSATKGTAEKGTADKGKSDAAPKGKGEPDDAKGKGGGKKG